jgi:hypothetical protein
MAVAKHKRRGCRYWRNLGLFALLAGFIGLLFILYVGHPDCGWLQYFGVLSVTTYSERDKPAAAQDREALCHDDA